MLYRIYIVVHTGHKLHLFLFQLPVKSSGNGLKGATCTYTPATSL